jgi:predicted aldo/keto reductase-like oxidoreductase
VVIPGMAEEKELQQNLAAVADTTPLSLEEKQKINRIRSTLGTQFCRRCNYCAPCPMGIGIPGIFVLEGYFSRYNLQDWAMTRYNGTPVKASACIGCGACEARCPYQLPIRKMLKNVVNLMEK